MGFLLLAMLSGVTKGDTTATATAYSAAMFYVITYVIMSVGAFGMLLYLSRAGFDCENLDDLKGLSKTSPWYAFVMLILMFSLDPHNWWRLFTWLLIGFIIYFGYSRKHSVLARRREKGEIA